MFVAACPLVLASASPRRQELLRVLGLDFACIPADIDESAWPGEDAAGFATRMAREKAGAVARAQPAAACVIGADTVVAIDGRVLGKPQNHAEALAFLSLLNGRTHTVITGYNVRVGQRGLNLSGHVCSRVQFGNFPEEVLAAYAATPEPMDKAGAYAMQGAGCFLVRAVDGSSSNVIGLPVGELVQLLLQQQIIAPVTGNLYR